MTKKGKIRIKKLYIIRFKQRGEGRSPEKGPLSILSKMKHLQ
jgi:hypothetical protein